MFTNVLNLMRHAGGARSSKARIRGRGRKFPREFSVKRIACGYFPVDFSLNAPRLGTIRQIINKTRRVYQLSDRLLTKRAAFNSFPNAF